MRSFKPFNQFTLIEILISVAIVVIGLVGIMAVFPVGIEANKVAMIDTACATLANSLRNAIVASVQSSPAAAGVVPPVVVRHDGIPTTPMFNLDLNPIPDSDSGVTNWYDVGTASAPGAGVLAIPIYFIGVGSAGLNDIVVFNSQAPAHPYNNRTGPGLENQLSFKVLLRKYAMTLPYLGGGTRIPFENLFELQIEIYRNFNPLTPATQVPIRAYTTLFTGNRIVE
jgi:type II secretory pathway pseudopilin PulG